MAENERIDRLTCYKETVRYAMADGSGPGFKKMREKLATDPLSDAQRALLGELDAEALEDIIELDFVEPDLLEDDPAQPLEKWWWHLGAIRDRTYPSNLLPAHLRDAVNTP